VIARVVIARVVIARVVIARVVIARVVIARVVIARVAIASVATLTRTLTRNQDPAYERSDACFITPTATSRVDSVAAIRASRPTDMGRSRRLSPAPHISRWGQTFIAGRARVDASTFPGLAGEAAKLR